MPGSTRSRRFTGNRLRALPSRLLAGRSALTDFRAGANRLETLPARLFAGASWLTTLHLNDNALAALPDGVFESLTALTALDLGGNPGSADFRPVVDVGADRENFAPGRSVGLDADVQGGPWGTNVTVYWDQDLANDPAEITVWRNREAALAGFTVPEPSASGRYTITVTGAGGSAFAVSDSLFVDVFGAPVIDSVAITSEPPAGPTTAWARPSR